MKNVPTRLRNLKSRIDKLDVDKLVHIPVELSKLSDVVKNNVKKIYIMLTRKVEDKTSDITILATKITLNGKVIEAKQEIPSINNNCL